MPTNSNGAAKPLADFDQEVRFAVVMYGGASLAIYINGVAQEMLRLVRATAPEFGAAPERRAYMADEELRGSERVYRLLGRMLSRHDKKLNGIDKPTPGSWHNAPIRTRFVVDILTGTSAGGINAVFLAKALANDQNMDDLKKLWITEGDIGVLLNDEESYEKGELLQDGTSFEKLKFALQDDKGEPWSLLNSRRMYLKLLKALRGMDETPACEPGQSPLVDELDLFVTAVDMSGRILQLRLADKVVSEYKHRNVFQFQYRGLQASDTEPQNDLLSENNAFLAFAARATSANQAAFSPVNLEDATRIISPVDSNGNPVAGKDYKLDGEHPPNDEAMRIFYQEYLLQRAAKGTTTPADPNQLADAFGKIWFVDGGTLDNKPFSFVVDELPLRHADNFVDRKLLYIEPAPEHLERMEALKERPRIVKNAAAALSSLPRYETIVEDLTRLLERNRLIERIDHIMRGMDRDLIDMPEKEALTRDQLRDKFNNREKTLEWIRSKGTTWGGYQRLRVAEVTDDLTLLVARAAGFSEESDEFLAIRYLVRHWRDSNYDPHMERDERTGRDRRSQAEFLVDFDLMWAMRRIRFVLRKLNDLACLDDEARRIAGVPRNEKESRALPDEEGQQKGFRDAVRGMRTELNKALVELRGERRRLWSRDEANPFRSLIPALEINSSQLLDLLWAPTDADRREKAEEILATKLQANNDAPNLRTRADAVELLTEEVKSKLRKVIDSARHKCSKAMRPPEGTPKTESASPWNLFLRETLWYYYINFDEFDQISYPLFYSSGVGEETDIIDIFRVSPADAPSIINESEPVNADGKKLKKLAGTTLADFGAFLEEKFRVNDILWGRLDGAERIIAVLLQSNPELQDQMTQQAHRAILVEEKLLSDKRANEDAGMQRIVWQALDSWDDQEQRVKLLSQAAGMLPEDSTFRAYLETLMQGAEPRELFKQAFIRNYDAARQFTEDATLKTATRANRVLGGMFMGYLPADGVMSWKQRLAIWGARRLAIFTEAAIEPEGTARRQQKLRLVACYLLSLLILALVCFPVVALWRSSTNGWAKLGYVAIFIVTLPLALLPLGLTGGYNYLWLKLKGKLASLLRR